MELLWKNSNVTKTHIENHIKNRLNIPKISFVDTFSVDKEGLIQGLER